MCYRCSLCKSVVPQGNPLLRHVLYKETIPATTATRLHGIGMAMGVSPRRDIARELPICGSCRSAIRNCVPMTKLCKSWEQVREAERLTRMEKRGKTVKASKGKSLKAVKEEKYKEMYSPPKEAPAPPIPVVRTHVLGQPVVLGGRSARKPKNS